ncbi:MAG TPA: hypothetical protein VMR51_01930 [Patescibacteria group bacterium]|nr:hypothetical protein [Patescibacteria group bacterium]
MERSPSFEEVYLNLRNLGGYPQIDIDPLATQQEKETAFMSEPNILRDSVATIFNKYALPSKSRGVTSFYTPNACISLNIIGKESVSGGEIELFISHIAEKNVYAIIRQFNADGKKKHLPIYIFRGSGDKTEIFSQKGQKLETENERYLPRLIIDGIKCWHEYHVRYIANSAKLDKFFAWDKGAIKDPDYYEFYIKSAHTNNPYKAVNTEVMQYGDALEEAMQVYYDNCPEDKPTYTGSNPLELAIVGAMFGNECKVLPTKPLKPLFRELTTYDSDSHYLTQFRRNMIWRDSIN